MKQLIQAVLKKSVTEKMTNKSRILLQSEMLKLAPIDLYSIPFAAMTGQKALEIATDLVIEAWTKDETLCSKFTSSLSSPEWTLDLEKRNETGDLLPEEVFAKMSKKTSDLVTIGQPFRKRDLRTEKSKAFSKEVPEPKSFVLSKDFADCSLITRVPSSKIVIGYKKDKLIVGTYEKASATVETTISKADFLDSEIVPCGAIVVTIGCRNDLSGGLSQQESLAFRLDENLSLVPYSLTNNEAREAEDASDDKIEGKREYDFNENSCPLSALSSAFSTQIILSDKIIYETEGTVRFLKGAPNDFWIAFQTGRLEHIVDGVKVSATRKEGQLF